MDYFRQKNNQQNIKTLFRVLFEWNIGKEKIRYTIKIRKSQWDFAFDMVTCVLWGTLGLGALVLGLRDHLLFPLGIVTYMCGIVVYMFARRDAPYIFIINRKKKKLYWGTYGMERYRECRYGEPIQLPTFRLPDNDTGQYEKMREDLQRKITTETGWLFSENAKM